MILVTGATGRLGRRIVRLLRRARLPVRALVRPGSHYYELNDTDCDYFFGDLRDPVSLRRALEGCDRLVHAAGVRLDSTDNHHAAVVEQGSRDLWAAARHHRVQKVVMVSCLGAERSLPHPTFDCLARAEESLAESGLAHTILRCAPFIEELLHPRCWGSPEARISPIWRQDAAIAALAALDDQAPTGALALGGPEVMSARDAVERAHALAGTTPQWMPLPRLVARVAGLAGRRWRTHIERMALLLGQDMTVQANPLGVPMTAFDDAVRMLLDETPPEDTHRSFQATIYAPGVVPQQSLPEGPLRKID